MNIYAIAGSLAGGGLLLVVMNLVLGSLLSLIPRVDRASGFAFAALITPLVAYSIATEMSGMSAHEAGIGYGISGAIVFSIALIYLLVLSAKRAKWDGWMRLRVIGLCIVSALSALTVIVLFLDGKSQIEWQNTRLNQAVASVKSASSVSQLQDRASEIREEVRALNYNFGDNTRDWRRRGAILEEAIRRGIADSEQSNEFLWGLRLGHYRASNQDRWGTEQDLLSRIDAELEAIEQARVNFQRTIARVGGTYTWATYIIAIPSCLWWIFTGLLGWVKRGFFPVSTD